MLKQIVIGHLLLVLLGAIPWMLFNDAWQNSLSWVIGGAIVNLNLMAISWAWKQILEKKLVALAVSLIVIKYAFIAGVLYVFVEQSWFKGLAFGAGIGSFIVVLAGLTLFSRKSHVL